MISGITAGSTTTVNVSFDVSSGTASAGYRTETAQLFFNWGVTAAFQNSQAALAERLLFA
jgi:hypothetical protein